MTPSPVYVTRTAALSCPAAGFEQRGVASYYGPGFHGRLTASGEMFDMHDMTCAHRSLPFGTLLLVRNLDNGLEATVRVNDRGPFVAGRIIDLSVEAAERLGMIESGTARVLIRVTGAVRDE
ncbi:septal ring lytic transglycosylase RlpA family protein [Candidatus Fermentibacterales bacterium]|nr:septal ring lytic transglycosylase RlpA family protein [Candidatus Fermentibacterales bacterium]